MPRLRNRRHLFRNSGRGYDLELLIGTEDLSEDELQILWDLNRDRLMETRRNGSRPWAFWHFDLGEPKPPVGDAETIRLAELDLLTDEERADIARKAAEVKPRIGTEAEHVSAPGSPFEQWPDREAVALNENVSRLNNRPARWSQ